MAGAHLNAARAFAQGERPIRALAALQRAPDVAAPAFAQAALDVAEAFVRANAPERACAVLEGVTEGRTPDVHTAALFLRLAELLVQAERGGAARAVIERVLSALPDDPRAVALAAGLQGRLPGDDAERAPAPSAMPGFEVLFETPLFAALDLDALRAFYAQTEWVAANAGDALVLKGAPQVGLWLVVSGDVELCREDAQPMLLGRGQHAFALSLVRGSGADADLRAKTEAQLLHLSRPAYLALTTAPTELSLRLVRAFLEHAAGDR